MWSILKADEDYDDKHFPCYDDFREEWNKVCIADTEIRSILLFLVIEIEGLRLRSQVTMCVFARRSLDLTLPGSDTPSSDQ